MKCLVVGGTGFLGGAITDALVEDGHDVTVLSRGKTPRVMSRSVSVLQADRNGDLSVLADKPFDWVFDTCAFEPEAVKRLLTGALGGDCERYIFISSISVYGSYLKKVCGNLSMFQMRQSSIWMLLRVCQMNNADPPYLTVTPMVR